MDDGQDLRAALSTAADEVEPTDRLVRIRQQSGSARRRRRTWLAAGGSFLAAAAVVTVIVAVTGPEPTTGADPATRTTPEPSAMTIPVFYVGPGPSGPQAPDTALYSSLETGTSALELLMQAPSDPDYRTLWPAGSLISYTVTPDSISVLVSDDAPLDDAGAIDQLLFTLQSVEGTTAPLVVEATSALSTLSLEFDRPEDLDVLSHMSISEPTEGATYQRSAGSMTATGQGNSFEAGGGCFLRGDDGFEGGPYPVQMAGWIEPRLFPWEIDVDISDVPPGTYTFSCITDDPTGGAEGRGTDTDTRTVVVE